MGAFDDLVKKPKEPNTNGFRMAAQEGGFFDNILPATGAMMYAPVLGVRQMLGKATPQEVSDWSSSVRELSDTAGGMLGSIIGGAALPVAAATLAGPTAATVLPAAGMGAAFGFAEPVEEGETRLGNTMKGAAFNAAIPAAVATGTVVKRALIDPFRQKGQEAMAGRVLNRFASDAVKAADAATTPKHFVPGSVPTLAEATLDPGLATLQATLKSADPVTAKAALINRSQQNSQAQLDALRRVSGTAQDLSRAVAERGKTAAANYGQAFAQGIDQDMAEAVAPQIQNLVSRLPDGVINEAKALARMQGLGMDETGSVQGLHYVKLALDTRIANAKGPEKAILNGLKDDFLSTLEDVAPAYKTAMTKYAEQSKPINAMQTGQKLYNKVTSALMEGTEGQTIKPEVFANALRDEVSLVKAATGREATLRQLFPDADIQTLNAIKKDLQRQVQASRLGRVDGSPTAQYLVGQDILRQSLGPVGLPQGFAENALVTNFLNRPASFALKAPEEQVRGLLAQSLTNPPLAASLMRRAQQPGLTERLLDNRAYQMLAPTSGLVGLPVGGLLMQPPQQ